MNGDQQLESETMLLRRLRAGEQSACAELYRRHAAAVRGYASRMRRSPIDVDDVVAEVFLRVLQAVRSGHGPRDHPRTYLFTAVRRILAEWIDAHREEPVRDELLVEPGNRGPFGAPQTDPQTAHAERELLAMAFHRLPNRWRTVLWKMEVEGHRPRSIAAEFGLTPNATAVLAHRARNGLRTAYTAALSEHRHGPVSSVG